MKTAVFYLDKYGEPFKRLEMPASDAVALGVSDKRQVHVAGGASDKRLTALLNRKTRNS